MNDEQSKELTYSVFLDSFLKIGLYQLQIKLKAL